MALVLLVVRSPKVDHHTHAQLFDQCDVVFGSGPEVCAAEQHPFANPSAVFGGIAAEIPEVDDPFEGKAAHENHGASVARISSGRSSHNRVLPSISVNKNVTVPVGVSPTREKRTHPARVVPGEVRWMSVDPSFRWWLVQLDWLAYITGSAQRGVDRPVGACARHQPDTPASSERTVVEAEAPLANVYVGVCRQR